MLCTSGFADDVIFHMMEPMGQNQTQRHVSSSSPGGGTGGEVAVYDCRHVSLKTKSIYST